MMKHTLKTTLVGLTALLAMVNTTHAQQLDWEVAPYFWMANAGLDMTIFDDPVLGVDVPFSDLVDKLDGALMLHGEVRGPRFGAFADIIAMSVSDSGVTAVPPGGPVTGDLFTNTNLKLGLYEIGGMYRFGEPAQRSVAIDVLLGVRLLNVDQSVNITLPDDSLINRTANETNLDFLMGARAVGMFAERWGYKVRADYSRGGTKGTFNFEATVNYHFGETDLFTLDMGYRHLQAKLSKGLPNGAAARSDVTLSGPVVGLIFSF